MVVTISGNLSPSKSLTSSPFAYEKRFCKSSICWGAANSPLPLFWHQAKTWFDLSFVTISLSPSWSKSNAYKDCKPQISHFVNIFSCPNCPNNLKLNIQDKTNKVNFLPLLCIFLHFRWVILSIKTKLSVKCYLTNRYPLKHLQGPRIPHRIPIHRLLNRLPQQYFLHGKFHLFAT